MKRPRTSQKPSHSAHKRQKVETPKPKPSATKTSAPGRKVRLNELSWQTVSMPDRLEDFEGFYGLEEIDDVDVVRDGATISFETRKSEEQLAKEREAQRVREYEEAKAFEEMREKQGAQDLGAKEEEEVVESEWEGFSDEEGQDGKDNGVEGQNGDKEDVEDTDKEEQSEEEVMPQKKKGTNAKDESPDAPAPKESKSKKKKTQNGDDKQLPTANGAFDILADRSEDDDEGPVDVSAWADLGLSKETLASLSSLKFSQPTDIQSLTIPDIKAGRDVIGKASTGSGKTLAFGIPILESYLKSPPDAKKHAPLALIVSPTRELAHQLSAHLTALCSEGDFKGPSIATVTGGLAVQKQRRQLEKADIVVGTPGRLWEVISSGQGLLASFKKIRFLVVDEADRLLSQGHYKELGEILSILDRDDEAEDGAQTASDADVERQTLVFSATFHKGLQQKLAGKASKGGGDLLNKQESMEYLLKKLNFREEKPKFIDANPTSQMASGLNEGLIECAGTEKDLYLYALLLYHPKKRALVFTNSVSAVRRVTPFLQNLNVAALPLHSGMAQKARLRSIERFTQRPGSVLVATDVAARGLDITGVELVVHYHLPRAADTYVHRSGRTARAEASGSSILICGPEEVAGVRRLVAKVHARAEQDPTKPKKKQYFIRTLDIDRRIVSRLKPRATLAKKLADATAAKEKKHSEDDWMREAAEELGVDYDSETFETEAKGKKGRGSGRKKKEKEARQLTKAEMGAMRAELKSMLTERINAGVSPRYLTSGAIDVEALMKGEGNLEFLGDAGVLGFDDE
ncbi:DEAD-domain-containing protein [Bimuria novae-zelandiae CBS 107.79]|uniref:RNA helicase n=1 Tax=Bimuria novae-zelandiae CBS 107.79 TaxID=1447943 RepID=A0A6A5VHQ5_9PLEO|nr:DEAD-domain-containing protein [Bimuria novae-zelandiae CBS 107.79]